MAVPGRSAGYGCRSGRAACTWRGATPRSRHPTRCRSPDPTADVPGRGTGARSSPARRRSCTSAYRRSTRMPARLAGAATPAGCPRACIAAASGHVPAGRLVRRCEPDWTQAPVRPDPRRSRHRLRAWPRPRRSVCAWRVSLSSPQADPTALQQRTCRGVAFNLRRSHASLQLLDDGCATDCIQTPAAQPSAFR